MACQRHALQSLLAITANTDLTLDIVFSFAKLVHLLLTELILQFSRPACSLLKTQREHETSAPLTANLPLVSEAGEWRDGTKLKRCGRSFRLLISFLPWLTASSKLVCPGSPPIAPQEMELDQATSGVRLTSKRSIEVYKILGLALLIVKYHSAFVTMVQPKGFNSSHLSCPIYVNKHLNDITNN